MHASNAVPHQKGGGINRPATRDLRNQYADLIKTTIMKRLHYTPRTGTSCPMLHYAVVHASKSIYTRSQLWDAVDGQAVAHKSFFFQTQNCLMRVPILSDLASVERCTCFPPHCQNWPSMRPASCFLTASCCSCRASALCRNTERGNFSQFCTATTCSFLLQSNARTSSGV